MIDPFQLGSCNTKVSCGKACSLSRQPCRLTRPNWFQPTKQNSCFGRRIAHLQLRACDRKCIRKRAAMPGCPTRVELILVSLAGLLAALLDGPTVVVRIKPCRRSASLPRAWVRPSLSARNPQPTTFVTVGKQGQKRNWQWCHLRKTPAMKAPFISTEYKSPETPGTHNST